MNANPNIFVVCPMIFFASSAESPRSSVSRYVGLKPVWTATGIDQTMNRQAALMGS